MLEQQALSLKGQKFYCSPFSTIMRGAKQQTLSRISHIWLYICREAHREPQMSVNRTHVVNFRLKYAIFPALFHPLFYCLT